MGTVLASSCIRNLLTAIMIPEPLSWRLLQRCLSPIGRMPAMTAYVTRRDSKGYNTSYASV